MPGFDVWWSVQQQLLGQDRAARFFLKLRNYSQKEGRISLVGTRIGLGSRRRWTYRFAGTAESVPPELLQRDVSDCCTEHVSKLARVVLACTEQFPFHTCPRRAITPKGMEALQMSMGELGTALGLPSGWVEAGRVIPVEHQLRLLREQVDGLDFQALKRLVRTKTRRPAATPNADASLGGELLTHLVAHLEGQAKGWMSRRLSAKSCYEGWLRGMAPQPVQLPISNRTAHDAKSPGGSGRLPPCTKHA